MFLEEYNKETEDMQGSDVKRQMKFIEAIQKMEN